MSAKVFDKQTGLASETEAMTVQGTVNKTALMLIILLLPALYTWNLYFSGGHVTAFIWGGAIAGLVLAVVTVFKKEWSPVTAPAYAVCEGLFLGALSAMFEAQYTGIAIQAVALTFGTLASLLLAYRTGLIVVTENFRKGVIAATGAIALVYFLNFILSMFGISMPYLHSNGLIGIGISLVIVVVAALNLVLDFDFIQRAAEQNLPKYMEWFGAFGLIVTLVWLYIEFLRLLSKIRSR
ncbi:MAG: hypothetical protein BRD50_05760 [Bacteroidetes bacterium SW_11_45_7]|nr:MAG: hypothetical protein BRD50_05760 [Bacteroidetes bacterium SW_11_45_7]